MRSTREEGEKARERGRGGRDRQKRKTEEEEEKEEKKRRRRKRRRPSSGWYDTSLDGEDVTEPPTYSLFSFLF